MARRKKPSTSSNALQNASSQPNSKFFELPAELRNRVYEMVFENARFSVPITDAFRNPNMLLTCKAVYAEARQIYYSKCHFRLHNAMKLRCWLDNIGPASAKSLTNLEIQPEMGNRGPNYSSISRTKRKIVAEEALCRVDHILQAKNIDIEIGALRFWSKGKWWCWKLNVQGVKHAVEC